MDSKVTVTAPFSATAPFTSSLTTPLVVAAEASTTTPTPPPAATAAATGTAAAPAAVVPKVEQSLAARFLGSAANTRSSVRLTGDSRRGSGASDDTELSKRILETHETDDRGLAVKPVLQIIDVIFSRATADFPGYTQVYTVYIYIYIYN